jgi:Nucleotide modification associated domain 1
MTKTQSQYSEVVRHCKDLFLKKNKDYGTAWRILRLASITDQIYIKALRIRSIEQKGTQKVDDPIASEFVGILNYCVMALIQLEHPVDGALGAEIAPAQLEQLYDAQISANLELLSQKNHDYDEAWRLMRISSMTDLILMKLLRIKQIEDNAGATLVSEGLDANYRDMINYAAFALIRMREDGNF